MQNYTVEQALSLANIGRTRFYREVRDGRISIVKVGRKTLVPESSLQTWQQRLIAEAQAARAAA